MTKKAQDDDTQQLNPQFKPLIEDQELPEEEPNHPGWLSIGEILKVSHPVFENSRFLDRISSFQQYLCAGR